MPEAGATSAARPSLMGYRLAILGAELFIPSSGLLTVAAVGCFVAAIVKVFSLGTTEGVVALVMTLVFVPAIVYFAIKVWLRTPMGRAAIRIAAVVLVQDPGTRRRIEGRVGHREIDATADHVAPSPLDLRPLDTPRLHFRRNVAGERVERLIVVVVAVVER